MSPADAMFRVVRGCVCPRARGGANRGILKSRSWGVIVSRSLNDCALRTKV